MICAKFPKHIFSLVELPTEQYLREFFYIIILTLLYSHAYKLVDSIRPLIPQHQVKLSELELCGKLSQAEDNLRKFCEHWTEGSKKTQAGKVSIKLTYFVSILHFNPIHPGLQKSKITSHDIFGPRSPNLVRFSRNLQQMSIMVSCLDYNCLWACTCTHACTAHKIVHAHFQPTLIIGCSEKKTTSIV